VSDSGELSHPYKKGKKLASEKQIEVALYCYLVITVVITIMNLAQKQLSR
jgi:hypothetical protein